VSLDLYAGFSYHGDNTTPAPFVQTSPELATQQVKSSH